MNTDEIIKWVSDNYRLLISVGGLICFIALFLPFWAEKQTLSSGVVLTGLTSSIYETRLLWIYLIVLIGLYVRYSRGYGEKYPPLYLVIGGLLFLLTICATQVYSGAFALYHSFFSGNSYLSFGFFFEVIGSLAVTVGGYCYYKNNNT